MFNVKPTIEREWYVVFDVTTKPRWYNRFLKKGFDHVYIMQLSAAGHFWIVINPVWSHVEIDYRSTDTFPTARDYAGPYSTIIRHKSTIIEQNNATWLGIMTCTDVIKRCIGLRKWRIFTPHQLYKHLARVSKWAE